MKDKILELRNEGKSFREIEKILGCSKATISYHCSTGQKQKTLNRTKKKRSTDLPLERKLEAFKSRGPFKRKCERFQMRVSSDVPNNERSGNYVKSMTEITLSFRGKDVLEKFGQNPKCYLTGRLIDWRDTNTYAFDHITPVSKNGSNQIDNLGICHPDANKGKSDLSVEDYIQLCKEVLENNGYIITK